jgi:hypothetical protein
MINGILEEFFVSAEERIIRCSEFDRKTVKT